MASCARLRTPLPAPGSAPSASPTPPRAAAAPGAKSTAARRCLRYKRRSSCRVYAFAVGQRLRGAGDGRFEVGHDQRAAELRCGMRHHGLQSRAVAHMQVPIIGAGD